MSFNTSNTARFNAIMNSRVEIGLAHVGQPVQLRITNATYGFYDEKNELLKDIYNTNASKATVLDSQWFKDTYAEAIKLEKAGDHDGARILFDDMLNKSTLTFSVINNNGTATQFVKDQQVICPIEAVEAGTDKHQAVVVNKPYAVAAKVASKGRRFTEEIA